MKQSYMGLLGIGVALAVAGCSDTAGGPAEPNAPQAPSLVTFGAPDGNAHPYVGALLFVQNGVGYYSCTGTLISPTVMVTAGHCVESEGNLNSVTYVRFNPDALAGYAEAKSTSAWLKSDWIKAKQVIAHPQYADFAQFPNTYDVGLVILSQAVTLPEYGALPPIDLLATLSSGTSQADKLFTAVGYGQQGEINPFYSNDFTREAGTTMLIEASSTRSGENQSAKFTNNPGLEGGTCYGDSGGPIFQGTTNVIGAITSFGYTPCIGNDFNFRLDTRTAQDFIRQYLR